MKVFSPILIPAAIATVAWLVSWRLWNRQRLARHGHWGGAAALALGYAAAYVTLMSWPPFPANTAAQWLTYLALLAGVAALAEAWWSSKTWLRWGIWISLGGLAAWMQFRAMAEYTWSAAQAALWIGGLALATAGLCAVLDKLAERRKGASMPLVLWLVVSMASAALVLTGSALLGQLAGSIAGMFGAATLLAWWAPSIGLNCGAMTVFGLLYVALLAQGHLYSELPFSSAALLYLAPFAAWLGETDRVRAMRAPRGVLARMGLVAIPAVIGVAIAFLVWQSTSGGDEYSY